MYLEDSICDGSESTTFNQTYCLLPMERFIDEPYSLKQGERIVAIVSALNEVGLSPYSTDNLIG